VHGILTSDLRIRNRCRLYLQVARLSDITNMAGTHLYEQVIQLDREPLADNTIYRMLRFQVSMAAPATPGSQSPYPVDYGRSTYSHMTLLQADGRLRLPLGKWDTVIDNRDRKYHRLYHAYSKTIHQYDGRVYRSFPIRQTNRRYIHAELVAAPIASASTPGYPVDVNSIQDNVLTAKYQAQDTITTRPRRS
jgi:hypothetical protein